MSVAIATITYHAPNRIQKILNFIKKSAILVSYMFHKKQLAIFSQQSVNVAQNLLLIRNFTKNIPKDNKIKTFWTLCFNKIARKPSKYFHIYTQSRRTFPNAFMQIRIGFELNYSFNMFDTSGSVIQILSLNIFMNIS